MKKRIKQKIDEHKKIKNLIRILINYFSFNKIKGKKYNFLNIYGTMRKVNINLLGSDNEIVVGNNVKLFNTNSNICGNGNKIIIEEGCYINNGDICIEDNECTIFIGRNTHICGKTHLACIEGSSIYIGEGCLFSSEICIRTGDSHSILKKGTSNRINPSLSVKIGNNVWIGNKVTILKGSEIFDSSIVGTGAIVTKKFTETNVILVGNPAKVVKRDVEWIGPRI